MYCNNCGLRGHVFRDCQDPIVSCGIILVQGRSLPLPSESASVLMIRRKDSMSYTEFLRGKYRPDNVEYINTLIQNMTIAEQELLRTQSFDTLWCKLWGYGVEHHHGEYPAAKFQYEHQSITDLLNTNPSVYTETEWGFPKGRRIRCETDLDCAIREFHEETNVPREAYAILKNIMLSETFRGTNGVMYKHVYHVAILRDESKIQLDQKFTAMQRREISAISWKSLAECSALTRPHYTDRAALLESLVSVLSSFETHAMSTEQEMPA